MFRELRNKLSSSEGLTSSKTKTNKRPSPDVPNFSFLSKCRWFQNVWLPAVSLYWNVNVSIRIHVLVILFTFLVVFTRKIDHLLSFHQLGNFSFSKNILKRHVWPLSIWNYGIQRKNFSTASSYIIHEISKLP